MRRDRALAVLRALHGAQGAFYAGGPAEPLRALLHGRPHHWSTAGLYRLRGEQIAECWLLALDQAAFDAAWRAR